VAVARALAQSGIGRPGRGGRGVGQRQRIGPGLSMSAAATDKNWRTVGVFVDGPGIVGHNSDVMTQQTTFAGYFFGYWFAEAPAA